MAGSLSFTRRAIVRQVLLIASFIALIVAFAVFLWALVYHAQVPSSHSISCEDRLSTSGFRGNPDFYGLGIRLGIYFQWIASLAAYALGFKDRSSFIGAWVAFSAALLVAIMILTFQQDCTFTAEIIVVLFFWWGGYMGLGYGSEMNTIIEEYKPSAKMRATGLGFACLIPYTIMVAYSTWFWFRMTSVGDVDFASTADGTCLLLVTKIGPSRSRAAAGWVTFICFVAAVCAVLRLLILALEVFTSLMRLMKPQNSATASATMSPRHSHKIETSPFDLSNKWGFTCAVMAAGTIIRYSIIAIELTLAWSHVSGVYDIASTGQIIPSVIGIGLLINVVWQVGMRKYFFVDDDADKPDDDEKLDSGPSSANESSDVEMLKTRMTW